MNHHVDTLRTMLPNEARAITGIRVRRVGLLWFELEADATCAQGLLTLDDAEFALGYMTTVPALRQTVAPPRTAVVAEVTMAILLGRTLIVEGSDISRSARCTVGPVLDENGAPAGYACVDFDGVTITPTETWDECDEFGYAHARAQADSSPFGAALAFVRCVGGARASEALPGMVVPWYCQAAVDHGHAAPTLPQGEPAAPVATDAQSEEDDATVGQAERAAVDPDATCDFSLKPRTDLPSSIIVEQLPPLRVATHPERGQRGNVTHLVTEERIERGRWVREPGQAFCKPRGLRLLTAGGVVDCKGCLDEVEKRNIVLK